MLPPTGTGTAGRTSIRQGTRASSAKPSSTRPSSLRPPSALTASSRNDRTGAASRAASRSESLSSTTTSPKAGVKRKAPFDSTFNEETNITVVVRCRGRNKREVQENSAVVVNTNGVMGKNVELSMGPNALSNKTYSFDRVFSQAADQSMIFDDVVKPIMGEVRRPRSKTGERPKADCSRCLRVSTVPYSLTARLVLARLTPCPAT